MNKHESDVLKLLLKDSKLTQRQISEKLHLSLGLVNKIIKTLKQKEYLSNSNCVTSRLISLAEKNITEIGRYLGCGFRDEDGAD